MTSDTTKQDNLKARALLYHSVPQPGKIEVVATKPLVTQDDLSLGYTPGVADVCMEIAADAEQANMLTSKANLVAVITNGTAVLGLGNIGPLASKPVMEGKAVLFKKFSNIDVFDIEVAENDPDAFVDTVARLAPTFGGINLEDIKAPECFIIEEKLRERLDIPVLHDDQHGTAIIVCAAFQNAMKVQKKKVKDVKICCVGAGAAGLACMHLLVDYGVPIENITLVDRDGVLYEGREKMNKYLAPFAHKTDKRTMAEAINGADVFFGLSAAGILTPDLVKTMAKNPVIFAMANPTPEIMPNLAREVRPDAIIGTGRSDFPNQINNVLGFPFLFRGALDCGAKTFNTEMKLAAATALAELAQKEADAELANVYKGATLKFGPDYLIPKPFDSRLLSHIAPAVAKAAMETGVATRPIEDLEAYASTLHASMDQSFSIMREIASAARKLTLAGASKRIVFPEGEDTRILQAAQSAVNEKIAHPVILGRRDIIEPLLTELGLSMQEGEDFTLIDPQTDEKLEAYTQDYYEIRKRDGVTPKEAAVHMRGRWMTFACMMVRNGDADGIVAGLAGRFQRYLNVAAQIINGSDDLTNISALQLIMQKERVLFMSDTHVTENPTAEQLAVMAAQAVDEVQHFGVSPRVGLLSHSNFGSSNFASAQKMKEARAIIRQKYPNIWVEGEMQADTALDLETMHKLFPNTPQDEPANVLIMPNLDAANIAFNMIRMTDPNAEYIGPILLGMKKPVHILNVDAPVRRIVNMTALAAVQAQ